MLKQNKRLPNECRNIKEPDEYSGRNGRIFHQIISAKQGNFPIRYIFSSGNKFLAATHPLTAYPV